MLTQQEEDFLVKFVALEQAKIAYDKKVEEYTVFRGSLDDIKDFDMIQKSQPYEDEIKVLEADIKAKEADLKK